MNLKYIIPNENKSDFSGLYSISFIKLLQSNKISGAI